MILALNLSPNGDITEVASGFATIGVAMAYLYRRFGTEFVTKDCRSGSPVVVHGQPVCKLVAEVYCDELGRMLPGQMKTKE